LNKDNVYEGAYVVNMANFGNPGTHWVSFWKEDEDTTYYFDSYGVVSPDTIKILFDKNNENDKVLYTSVQIQCVESTLCAQFCLLFLYIMKFKKGGPRDRIKFFFKGFNTNKLFLTDNDDLVIEYLNAILGSN
jgi:hypothetical protein